MNSGENYFYEELLQAGRGLTDSEMIKYIKYGKRMAAFIKDVIAASNAGHLISAPGNGALTQRELAEVLRTGRELLKDMGGQTRSFR